MIASYLFGIKSSETLTLIRDCKQQLIVNYMFGIKLLKVLVPIDSLIPPTFFNYFQKIFVPEVESYLEGFYVKLHAQTLCSLGVK